MRKTERFCDFCGAKEPPALAGDQPFMYAMCAPFVNGRELDACPECAGTVTIAAVYARYVEQEREPASDSDEAEL